MNHISPCLYSFTVGGSLSLDLDVLDDRILEVLESGSASHDSLHWLIFARDAKGLRFLSLGERLTWLSEHGFINWNHSTQKWEIV